jgi:hypothetical protein
MIQFVWKYHCTVGLVLMPFAQKYAQLRRKFSVWDRNDSVCVEILLYSWAGLDAVCSEIRTAEKEILRLGQK